MSTRQTLGAIVAAVGAVPLALIAATSSVHAQARQLFTSLQMKNVTPVAVPLDADTAAKRLSNAITFRTVSNQDRNDFDEKAFEVWLQYLADTFSGVHRMLEREVLGQPRAYNLLYTWAGKNPSLPPIVLLAHQADDKPMVLAILDAVEMHVAKGFQPNRTIYLAFRQGEEVGGPEGTKQVVQTLQSRGVKEVVLVVDEGLPLTTLAMAITASAQNDSPGTSQAPDTQRISDIRDENEVVTGAELKAADFPGLSIAIPGTNARIGFGGFAKLDAIADFSGVGDKYEFIIGKIQVPAEGAFQKDRYFYMHARESRFYLDFRNITASGRPLRVYLEQDFWMKESSDFRLPLSLRHLYAVYNNVSLGYSWATVTDPLSWPITVDFSGEILNGGRRTVLRWEQPGILPGAKWAVSIENDFFPNIYNPSGLEGEASPRFPILAASINQKLGEHPHGHWMLGAQVRELRWDGPTKNATAMSWLVALSGRAYLGKDFFTWNAAAGDGLAGNTSTLLSSDQSAVLTPEERVEPVFAAQATLGSVTISPRRWRRVSAYGPSTSTDIQSFPKISCGRQVWETSISSRLPGNTSTRVSSTSLDAGPMCTATLVTPIDCSTWSSTSSERE